MARPASPDIFPLPSLSLPSPLFTAPSDRSVTPQKVICGGQSPDPSRLGGKTNEELQRAELYDVAEEVELDSPGSGKGQSVWSVMEKS